MSISGFSSESSSPFTTPSDSKSGARISNCEFRIANLEPQFEIRNSKFAILDSQFPIIPNDYSSAPRFVSAHSKRRALADDGPRPESRDAHRLLQPPRCQALARRREPHQGSVRYPDARWILVGASAELFTVGS